MQHQGILKSPSIQATSVLSTHRYALWAPREMEGLQLTNFRTGSQAVPKTSLFPKSSLDHSLEIWVGMGRFPSFFIFHREGGRFLRFRRRSMLDFPDALSRFPKQGGMMSLIGDIGKKDQNLSSVPFPLFQRVWSQDVTGGIKKVVLKSWPPR